MTPIEEVAQCIAAWDAEGLGDCPELHETNYPGAWEDVRALVKRLTEPAASIASGRPPSMSIEDMG